MTWWYFDQATKAKKKQKKIWLPCWELDVERKLFFCVGDVNRVFVSLCVGLKMLNTVSLSLLHCPEADTSICGRWWGKEKGVQQVAFVNLLLTWHLLSSYSGRFKGELSNVYNWKPTIYTKEIICCIYIHDMTQFLLAISGILYLDYIVIQSCAFLSFIFICFVMW